MEQKRCIWEGRLSPGYIQYRGVRDRLRLEGAKASGKTERLLPEVGQVSV